MPAQVCKDISWILNSPRQALPRETGGLGSSYHALSVDKRVVDSNGNDESGLHCFKVVKQGVGG